MPDRTYDRACISFRFFLIALNRFFPCDVFIMNILNLIMYISNVLPDIERTWEVGSTGGI